MARAVEVALIAVVASLVFLVAKLSESPQRERFTEETPGEVPAQVIHIYEYGFEPSRIVLQAGHAVVWRNLGKEIHRVTPATNAGIHVFKAADERGSVRHAFTRPGVYPYFSSIHTQMRGVVVVKRHL
jgi:plastocyanin